MNDKAERYQGDTVVFDTETLAMDKKAVVETPILMVSTGTSRSTLVSYSLCRYCQPMKR